VSQVRHGSSRCLFVEIDPILPVTSHNAMLEFTASVVILTPVRIFLTGLPSKSGSASKSSEREELEVISDSDLRVALFDSFPCAFLHFSLCIPSHPKLRV